MSLLDILILPTAPNFVRLDVQGTETPVISISSLNDHELEIFAERYKQKIIKYAKEKRASYDNEEKE